MRYEPLRSFDRSLKALSPGDKKRIKGAILRCVDAFESGQIPSGLGLKKLTSDVWELRAGLDLRVIFRRTGDLVQWLLAGRHDDVRRFLRNA